MASSDGVSAAFAAWSEAHRQLVDAEQQVSMLDVSGNSALRTAAQARVQQLRAESDRLLAQANSLLHGSGTNKEAG